MYSYYYFNNTNKEPSVLKYYYEAGIKRIRKANSDETWTKYIIKPKENKYVKSHLSHYFPSDIEVIEDREKVILRKSAESITVSNDVFPATKQSHGDPIFCSLLFGEDKVFITIFSSVGTSYPLYCYNKKNNILLWRAEVWANYPTKYPNYNSGPPLSHEVYFTETPKCIIVYGYDGIPYCEGFDKYEGKSVFRFSANLWNINENDDELLPYKNALLPR